VLSKWLEEPSLLREQTARASTMERSIDTQSSFNLFVHDFEKPRWSLSCSLTRMARPSSKWEHVTCN